MKNHSKSTVVAVPIGELLKMDFRESPKKKIYQHPHGDKTELFWDVYLHPGCVEVVDPKAQKRGGL